MTEGRNDNEGAATNPDLAAMHRDLIALVRRLEALIDTATTAATIAAISDQIVEVNARATATGRVLLAAQTQEIAKHAHAVSAAIPGVEREIENLVRFEQVVRGVAAVLDAADEAVRIARLVCR
ncbi:hypothetical protein EQZ23_06975 [Sphingomonas sp. UV9]|uniref:hypothetical protein n=1 Tax=Sphingomonas sp. UV9 TaxID=1851410 RepID=UPI000FFBC2E6|nr:hypothetical protein [Sphingomonas sp. UV9]RXD04876.1 hypothetical protein EQZ23_06975 [Sphingomonas sp. UV9]